MIKLENTEVVGWEAAIRGCRNSHNSWDRSDSFICNNRRIRDDETCNNCSANYECSHLAYSNGDTYVVGVKDLKLMKKLAKAGTDHRKFMRMIAVYVDVTAPMYWTPEHDTYKVGTVRNSCSFMHRGVSKPFEITDFSIDDTRVYEVLSPLTKTEYVLTYPYETEEYRIYTTNNGRKYKVFKNGRLFRCAFSYTDSWGTGRARAFEEREVIPSRTKSGYFEVNIGGRNGEKWMIHRLVAAVWIDNPDNLKTVNHIDGNKGNNSVENLEWMSLEDNIAEGYKTGLFNNVSTLHCCYLKWKNGHVNIDPTEKARILIDFRNGVKRKDLANKYNLSAMTINNILSNVQSENSDLFMWCYTWEKILDTLNSLRQEYLDTGDNSIFVAIRQLLPQGYNIRYTWQANYEVLANIYHSRKNHKLDEWHTFCDWIETLPYSEIITGKE